MLSYDSPNNYDVGVHSCIYQKNVLFKKSATKKRETY